MKPAPLGPVSIRRRVGGPLWAIAAILAGVGLIGATVRRPPAERALSPAPHGWVRTLEPGPVLAMAIRGDTLWAGGKRGLFELDAKSGAFRRRVPLPQDPIHIRSLAVGDDGSLWIGHTDGLIRLSEGRTTSWTSNDGLPANRVNVVRVVDGKVLVGTGAGLAERGPSGRWSRSGHTDELVSPVVNALLPASDGALWIGSNSDPKGGLTRISATSVQRWRVSEGLPHPYVQDIVEVAPGVVWVATGQWDQGGAVQFDVRGDRVALGRVLHQEDGLAGAKARSVAVDSNGSLWVGSENDGLAIEERGSFRVLTERDGLPHNEITTIVRDRFGAMWLGTLNGVVRIPPPLDDRERGGASK
ncbi:MAG: hypothetical protein KIS66_08480 [Fimbriimonadaceae bacterium]|nr:hypothetical protein [Fimbriimonadaceae bacterium]